MKTKQLFSKVTMLLAFVAFANTLMATGNLKVNILPLTSDRAMVSISNVDSAYFKIRIENEKGEIVYSKETEAESADYKNVFDFSDLETGNYKLSVTIGGLTSERPFKITDKNISVGEQKSILEPYFSFKDGILKLTYLNFSEENYSVNFYSKDELVYSKEIGDRFNVIEGFDLSNLESGAYTVVLSAYDKSFSYYLNIN
jgi:hypothetical protein